jgi:hypothetical protein
MRVARTAALVALPVLVAFSCAPREGILGETTSPAGGSGGTTGTGAQAGTGGHGGTGAQGAGGASNVCVLDQSKVDQCMLAP